MSASGAWGQAVDKVPLAHRLPPLIHPGPTLRRRDRGAYRISLYNHRLIKQPPGQNTWFATFDSMMNLLSTHTASGHGKRRSPGFGVTLVSVKSLKQTLVPRPRKAPDGYK